MAIQTIDKRALLRGIKWDADQNDLSLHEALGLALRGQIQEIATGKILTAATANGQSVSFALPASSAGMTPQDITRIVATLMDLYEEALAALPADPTDAQVFTAMMNRLRAVRSVAMEFGGLRYA